MSQPSSVIIVGGGTAGWMTACLMQKHWPRSHIQLIESSAIGTIGVGEGSTPFMKHFFAQIGLAESDWMPQCDATYKVGIQFDAWTQNPAYPGYFHPFFTPFDLDTGNQFFDAVNQRRQGQRRDCHPEHYFLTAELVRQGLCPSALNVDTQIDYAYHFDAGKLAEVMKQHCLSAGLTHIIDTIEGVDSDGKSIQRLHTSAHGSLEAELFVDCSGFNGILAKKALNRDFLSYADTLFNNAAVAIQTPHNETHPLQLQTRSEALSSGWMWQIPLTSRIGNGYVYCSDFISPEQAESELKHRLNIEETSDVKVRHLKMEVGRLEQHWSGNCAAIGLAQGFIEPLEATALMLVQYSISQLIDSWQPQSPASIQDKYNSDLNRMFDGIRDYIAAHYLLNDRIDSPYWQACRERMVVPPTLDALYNAWQTGQNFDKALNDVAKELVYLRPSWYCIFAGMGQFDGSDKDTVIPTSSSRQTLQALVAKYFAAN